MLDGLFAVVGVDMSSEDATILLVRFVWFCGRVEGGSVMCETVCRNCPTQKDCTTTESADTNHRKSVDTETNLDTTYP